MRKALSAVPAVLAAGFVLGTGVSGYADVPHEDCLDLGAQHWAPIGTECLSTNDGRAFHIGPTVGAWIGWMVAMTILAALAWLRRDSLVLRAALSAAAFLALCGVTAHAQPAIFLVMFIAGLVGAPLVFATSLLMTPRAERSPTLSVLVTLLLTPTVFFVATFFQFGDQGHVGMALALLAGPVIAATGARWLRTEFAAPTSAESSPG